MPCWKIQSEFFWLINLMFLHDFDYYNYVCFFTRTHIPMFYLIFNWFAYCIHLYTWSTQQVTLAQHMCWLLKASDSPVFFSINYSNFILDDFPFPFIYGPSYPTFQFHLVPLLFDVLLALFLVGSVSAIMEPFGLRSTPSIPLVSGLFWPGVVIPLMVQSMRKSPWNSG